MNLTVCIILVVIGIALYGVLYYISMEQEIDSLKDEKEQEDANNIR
jgi:hypothetical protein